MNRKKYVIYPEIVVNHKKIKGCGVKRFTDLGTVELRVFTPDYLYCLSEAGSESVCKRSG